MADITTKPHVGLALPALRNKGGYFGPKRDADKGWGDLLLTLYTPIGTRPMNRQFGSQLWQTLFNNEVVRDAPLMEFFIQDAASRWCPHVVIDTVSVAPDAGTKSFNISMQFRLATDRTDQSQTFLGADAIKALGAK